MRFLAERVASVAWMRAPDAPSARSPGRRPRSGALIAPRGEGADRRKPDQAGDDLEDAMSMDHCMGATLMRRAATRKPAAKTNPSNRRGIVNAP